MTEQYIQLTNLSKGYDKKPVLTQLNATVHSGEVIGLLGLNGAGKTTLLETMLGFAFPNEGSITLFGSSAAVQLTEELKHRIGFVPQTDELMPQMTARGYLTLISRFYAKWDHALIETLIKEWEIPEDTKLQKLSVGQRQKVSILAAIGHNPDLLVLDEPVASLDPKARRQFLKTIIDHASNEDKTVLFSTHIVSDLERIASRVWLIKEGRIVIDAALDELKESTVRLRLPSDSILPPSVEKLIVNNRMEGHQRVVTLLGWNESVAQELNASCANAHVENLSLEDIFLELHA